MPLVNTPTSLLLRSCEGWRPSSDPSFRGVRIRGTLGDIDPLNKVPFKKAIIRVKKRPFLRGLPNTTWDSARGPNRPMKTGVFQAPSR